MLLETNTALLNHDVSFLTPKEGVVELKRKLIKANFGSSNGVTTLKYVDKKGRVAFKGGPKLKASQSYPADFGHEVGKS